MEKGEAECSYTRNSSVQGQILQGLGPILAEAISQLGQLPSEEGSCIRAADLGCSVGANTLAWADLIARCVRKRFQEQSKASPEVQLFFADLPSNDFNTLLQALPPSVDMRHNGSGGRPYFAAAVAGSFYGRLFPRGSLHIAISTWSLHWLSKIPDAVLDQSSPAYNKGRVWINGGSPLVAEAYAQVSRQDLHNFFTNRAHELAPGGLLFLMLICRADHERKELQTTGLFRDACPSSGLLEETWDDLVTEGLIEPHKRDSFNSPIFHPSMEEIQEAIDGTGAYHIKKLEIWRDHHFYPNKEVQKFIADPEAYGLWAKNWTKALLNPLVEAHLGNELAAKLFHRLEQKTIAHVKRTKNVFCSMPGSNIGLVVLIRR